MNWYPDSDEPVSVGHAGSGARGHRIPAAPSDPGRWVPHDDEVRVAGYVIFGGMFYLGSELRNAQGHPESSMVVPRLPVSEYGMAREAPWDASYSGLNPNQRRNYLEWLSGGRRSSIGIGYLLLFLGGLERRVRIDTAKDSPNRLEALADLPRIAAEVRRLCEINKEARPFINAATVLLDVIELLRGTEPLYARPFPWFPENDQITTYLRLALGQCARDKLPVPADLALRWMKTDSLNTRSPAADRHPELFDALFLHHFNVAFPGGLLVRTRTTTPVTFKARMSNRGLGADVDATFPDTPDVYALVTPLKKLRDVAQAALKDLNPFARLTLKEPDRAMAVDGLLLLPPGVWPEHARGALAALQTRASMGPFVITLRELVFHFGSLHALNKSAMQRLQQCLAAGGVEMEPDFREATRAPGVDDPLVLFEGPGPNQHPFRSSALHDVARLTLQLGVVVAVADSAVRPSELQVLESQVDQWVQLSEANRQRLRAHLRLLCIAPPTLASLKSRLLALPLPARETLASFAVALTQVDGEASPEEIKVLEKAYKLLGLDAQRLYSELHATVGQGLAGRLPLPAGTHTAPDTAAGGFTLDQAKIAARIEDTHKVTALLANIFVDEEPAAAKPVDAAPEQVQLGLNSLDATHSAFVAKLVARSQWSRSELLDLASTFDLMLDGALETVNDASFDVHDMPLTEGEDPVQVNQEILQNAHAPT